MKDEETSPSPPSPQPQQDHQNTSGINVNDSSPIQFENMLPISTDSNQSNNSQNNHSQHHQQIPNLLSIPPSSSSAQPQRINGSSTPMHRHTKSESNLLISKQRALKYWVCSVCTFSENPIDYPVCKMCSALPPERPPSVGNNNNNSPQQIMQKNVKKASTTTTTKKSKHILDESIDMEMDPLGHQRSNSVKKLSIMDESALNKSDKHKQAKAQDLLGLIPKEAPNPSLMQVRGGVGYHNATHSGQNIIRGVAPYEVPDLPPESVQQQHKNEKKSIANMGVEVNGKNKARESGIGGFFGKVVNGWSARKRAQSTDDDPSNGRIRSRSPFGKKKDDKKV